jgi:hypothetical protein
LNPALKGPCDGLEVVISPIHGRGLWTERARRAGEMLYVVRGRPVSWPFDRDYKQGGNWIGTGWESWLVPERGSPIRFTNHGCEPNAIVSEGLAVVALEDIPSGSEVVLDYATTEVDPFWRLRCSCRSPRCRGQVRSFPFLPEALRARYTPHLPFAFLDAAQRVARTLSTSDGADGGEVFAAK